MLALALAGCAAQGPVIARPTALPALKVSDRQLIKTAGMRIEHDQPEAGLKRATELAAGLGGYVQRSNNWHATLLVPGAKLDEAMTALGELGKVTHREIRTDDVTEARRDLALRLDNLERTRARYLALLESAETVQDTLAIERELERITLEHERLRSQLEQVDSRIALAALDVGFEKPVRPGPLGWVVYGAYSAVKWLFVWN